MDAEEKEERMMGRRGEDNREREQEAGLSTASATRSPFPDTPRPHRKPSQRSGQGAEARPPRQGAPETAGGRGGRRKLRWSRHGAPTRGRRGGTATTTATTGLEPVGPARAGARRAPSAPLVLSLSPGPAGRVRRPETLALKEGGGSAYASWAAAALYGPL